ncbi:hypothetical protein SCLCIDRAFT_21983 [Scleroderma citrinum Foug A]|uniref:Uncharacterized protein n=1 Tax=Scleroderma citrinum Foug A TaxID=1036808 RepID=A0A0C3E174_9AGAM|nr:hypothetical protein SCLCIDRAFT_21983 [Scleroderma citrinum Foug A]
MMSASTDPDRDPEPTREFTRGALFQACAEIQWATRRGDEKSPDLIDHMGCSISRQSACNRPSRQAGIPRDLFLWRSFYKFAVCFREDRKRLCGDKRRLAELIRQWNPDPNRLSLVSQAGMLTVPDWLTRLEHVPKIKSTRLAGEQLQWEFSDKTKHDWSMILVALLSSINQAILEMEKTGLKKMGEEMVHLNLQCRYLYYFIAWDAEIVKELLKKTNMVDDIATKFMPMRTGNTADEFCDQLPEFRPEAGLRGNKSFRYLWMFLAWHRVVNKLCNDETLPKLLNNIDIILVGAPRSPRSVLKLDDITDEFFKRFPDRENDRRLAKVGFRVYKDSDRFSGRGGGECWEGCDWLGDNLESKFTLPGTHGEMYPWDPPTVGVSELVLKKLHEELWNQLHKVVLKSVVLLYSRHSSPSGALEEFYVPPESEAGQRIPQTVADTPSRTANDDGGPWETVLSKRKQKQQGKSSGTIVTRRG